MPKIADLLGIVGSTFTIGSRSLTAGVRRLAFRSGSFLGAIDWTPTANRTITLPDATGTVLLNTTTVPLAEPRTATLRLGTGAGSNNTTGLGWIAIGTNAGVVNTSGEWTAIGAYSGELNTTGGRWSAIGYAAGSKNISGGNWSAIGPYAGQESLGSFWMAIGTYAGQKNTSGEEWTAIGYAAGALNTTGGRWSAIGYAAGYGSTTGGRWTAIGYAAGANNTTGFDWTAIGTDALGDTTTSSNNTAIGYNTGRGITTGGGNTIVGANVTGLSPTLANNVILASGNGVIRLQIDSSGLASVASVLATSTTISTSTTTGAIQTTGVGIGGGRGSFSLATSYDDSATASQTNRSLYFNNGNTWAKRGDGSNVALSPLSLAAPVAVANVVTIPFDGVTTVLAQYNVISPVTLTPSSTRIQGASTIIVVSADGTNIPALAAGVRLFSDSATYSNVAGTLHVYTFYELGGTVWVRLSR